MGHSNAQAFAAGQAAWDNATPPDADADALDNLTARDQAEAEWQHAAGPLLDTLRNLDEMDGTEPMDLGALREAMATGSRELSAGEALVMLINAPQVYAVKALYRLRELVEQANAGAIAERARELMEAA